MMLSPLTSANVLKPAVVCYRDSPYNSPSLNRRIFSGIGTVDDDELQPLDYQDDDAASAAQQHLDKKARVIGELTSLIRHQNPTTDPSDHRSRPLTKYNFHNSKTLRNLQAVQTATSYSAPSSPNLRKAAQVAVKLNDFGRNGVGVDKTGVADDKPTSLTSQASIKISRPSSLNKEDRSRANSPACDPMSRSLTSTTSLNMSSSSSSASASASASVSAMKSGNMLKKTGVTGITTSSTKKPNPPPRASRSASADPRLDELSIQERIGNRSVKIVDKSIGRCGTCKKPVTSEGCTAFGNVFHKECFKCCVCKKRIDGKFFEKNGKAYCSKDYEKVVEECYVCKLPIKGDCVESNQLFYHPECMKCFVCGDQLRGSYFTFKNQPICEKDYMQRAQRCSVCNEIIDGKYYTYNDESYCEQHYREHCDKCPRCNEDVTGKHVKIAGAVFHPDCFSCVVCGKNMISSSFFSDSNHRVFCQEDYAKKRAYKCSFCKRPILPKDGQTTAPRIRALEKDFHPDCFKCEDCGLALDAKVKGKECYPWKNHVLCLKCNRKKLSSDESESDDEDDQ